uniref:O-fucosyltransferase family protein n=1 Tax=Aegilops tauschii subsp. strangulata TaxID=200361 RepID=A0A453HI53_AEGTS
MQVGMMLRGMGFDNTTSLYVASGKIYNAEKYMTPLRELFPLLQTKETITSPEELAQFKGHSSRLAALDYTVCLRSEAFVMTQGSNFPHFLMGHRRYLYGGHAKTITPDKQKMVLLFDNPDIRSALSDCYPTCLSARRSWRRPEFRHVKSGYRHLASFHLDSQF